MMQQTLSRDSARPLTLYHAWNRNATSRLLLCILIFFETTIKKQIQYGDFNSIQNITWACKAAKIEILQDWHTPTDIIFISGFYMLCGFTLYNMKYSAEYKFTLAQNILQYTFTWFLTKSTFKEFQCFNSNKRQIRLLPVHKRRLKS